MVISSAAANMLEKDTAKRSREEILREVPITSREELDTVRRKGNIALSERGLLLNCILDDNHSVLPEWSAAGENLLRTYCGNCNAEYEADTKFDKPLLFLRRTGKNESIMVSSVPTDREFEKSRRAFQRHVKKYERMEKERRKHPERNGK